MPTDTPKYLNDDSLWIKELPEMLRKVAAWEITIEVTPEMIAEGQRGACSFCPVALAIKKAIKPFFDLDAEHNASDFRIAINRQFGHIAKEITDFNHLVNWDEPSVAVTADNASIMMVRREGVVTSRFATQKVISFDSGIGKKTAKFIRAFDQRESVSPFQVTLPFYLTSYMTEEGSWCRYTPYYQAYPRARITAHGYKELT